MEQNVQVIAKRTWHIVRVAFFMVRKSINKKKLLLDLKYLTMKRRPNLAGKPLTANITHRHGGAYHFSFTNTKQGKAHVPSIDEKEREVSRVLEMMVGRNDDVEGIERVTDYPYPFQSGDEEGEMGNYRVDEAADEFIQRFYSQLSHQIRTIGA